MSLADRLPGTHRSIDGRRIWNIVWLSSLTFAFMVLAMILLDRLGLPQSIMISLFLTTGIVFIVVLAWVGRTMTSELFFFAGKISGIAPAGLSGLTDWMSGAFIMVFLGTSGGGKYVLAVALMSGLFLQTSLFSTLFRRTGVSTLPGLFSWRYKAHTAGFLALIVVSMMLFMIIIAEFTVAQKVLEHLAPTYATVLIWGLLVLAVIPLASGGWLAVLISNAVLGVWVLICVLTPAIATGFLSGALIPLAEFQQTGETLEPFFLDNITSQLFPLSNLSVPTALLCTLLLSTGLATLPHALSRSSLATRPIAAMESMGWSALGVFLILSAFPLSFGLIWAGAEERPLAQLLVSFPALQVLPYFALLFAAFNGLSVTIFVFCSTLVRAFRRSRNLDPGEQSMFSTRFLAVLVVIGLFQIITVPIASVSELFIAALVLGSAGLFLPLLVVLWGRTFPHAWVALSIFLGTCTVVLFISNEFFAFPKPINEVLDTLTLFDAGGIGLVAAALPLFIGSVWVRLRPNKKPDERLEILRRPYSNS